mmetsp:Transcript_21143/g.66885  ORF Transcript_21143/g.66885 Transcript_21143/m.66885 type:complete len:323 (+) Transcript_21143:1805-2773(+)
MSADHLLVQGVEGPVVVAVLTELGVRFVDLRVPEVSGYLQGREVVHGLGAHGLRVVEEILHDLLGGVALHVGLVLHVRRDHAEGVRLAVHDVLLQEDLEVGDLRPRVGPDVRLEGRAGHVADGGRDLLLQDLVHGLHELLVRDVGVFQLARGLGHHAAPRLGHEVAEARALAELRRGHLRGVAEGADAAEEHAGGLAVQHRADLLQDRGAEGQAVGDEDRMLLPGHFANGELRVPEVGVLGSLPRALSGGVKGGVLLQRVLHVLVEGGVAVDDARPLILVQGPQVPLLELLLLLRRHLGQLGRPVRTSPLRCRGGGSSCAGP